MMREIKGMQKTVTLVIPTYRNPEYLDLCLKSAVQNKFNSNNKILVIVDGYFEESQKVLEKYPNVLYLDLGENRGMQYALNVGVMQSDTDYIFIINDDNVMPKNWDTVVIHAFELAESVGDVADRVVLTVNQIEPSGPGMFNFPVIDLGQTASTFQYDKWLEVETKMSNNQTAWDGHIFPFMMKKKYYMAIGGFDTFYNSPNVCDWDFFLKLELLGFEFPRTRRLHLYHFGSVSTKKNAESQKFREREQAAFAEFEFKWGAPPFNGVNNTKINPSGFRGFSK
jgi:GT2 family glycosyltransferase